MNKKEMGKGKERERNRERGRVVRRPDQWVRGALTMPSPVFEARAV